jgi:hypothetical protein
MTLLNHFMLFNKLDRTSFSFEAKIQFILYDFAIENTYFVVFLCLHHFYEIFFFFWLAFCIPTLQLFKIVQNSH